VISTAAGKVVRVIPDPGGPQGLAVSPSGKTLYVTNPNGDDL
jgi:DNA-binding beta-propeller fold protein YncE